MEKNSISCNFIIPTVVAASIPKPFYIRIIKKIPYLFRRLKHIIYPMQNFIIYPLETNTYSHSSDTDSLNLQPGEWVEVRSFNEISMTLDEKGKCKGLYFMLEMKEFCEKKFRVFKKVEIIKLETTGEVRKLKRPSILLEGVYCNGENHEGCDRSCFHFWREAWLKRISI